MISVTSIEEIVKYQQELLNHQRNQKLIQQETIKLLNALNKNITFMSDRLDEFATKTNIKLEITNEQSTTVMSNVDSFFNNCYEPQNHNSNEMDIKDYLTLNDLDQSTQTVMPQQLVIIQQDSLVTKNSKTKIKSNKTNSNLSTNQLRSTSICKLLDTTNTTSASRTGTSDESIDEDISFDETTDEEEKETIQIKKKPRNATTILELTNNMQSTKTNTKEFEECNNQQRFFNKYVRESVERKLGKDFLLLHEIQEISPEVMDEIKREALQAYPPVNIRPRRAWHLAKASLRCRRRSLRRQKEKQILSSSSDNITIETSNLIDESVTSSSQIDISEGPKTIIKMSPI